jgi:hypothetical protein
VLLEIKINGELATPLSVICHRWGWVGVCVVGGGGGGWHNFDLGCFNLISIPETCDRFVRLLVPGSQVVCAWKGGFRLGRG